ncbi:hypothetical protein A8C56_12085 [Niabella ginsenosidivorans]|uniref:DUF5007 domain-containing protein n=1 Tax=Niabella ginsenosidivorans TaxID=1176587 RepID=A0A1A9I1T6_9BACT|nr:DUF5007 domain-containing protein [Niabella ginsenosidivorans]ANH81618.1 hypothetical protein A8C56_12085 [Niabella ginsenosidivorans]
MKNKIILFVVSVSVLTIVLVGCTKIGSGFLSPYVQYASDFTVIRGRVSSSYTLVTDGSSLPMKIKLMHVYNENGDIVDDMFTRTYPVEVWSGMYDPKTDTNYAAIMAKRKTVELPPIVVNESSGVLEANAGTLNLPLGSYSVDLQVSNEAGSEIVQKIINITLVDGKPVEITPETGAFSASLLVAGTAGGAGAAGGSNNGTLFNGNNNPFVDYTITRFADTPNVFVLKVVDRNGVVFNPKKGELAKRPNSGLNPDPPFLQNLQDYAPDTFQALDTAMILKYPLVPFPLQSLGNGFNMYYRIPTKYVQIDSTSAWSSNAAGDLYKGTADTHYLGVYTSGKFDYAIRIPMRIFVPGSYRLVVRLLNATHQ